MKYLNFIQKEDNLSSYSLKKNAERFLNNIRFDDGSYIFVYQLLNINGGKRFAKMLINPNRKDLVDKYLSDSYKDAKGNEFRKEFLQGIRKNGEAFVKYYYKKLGSNKISEKISYFKWDKKLNWVVATGVYLDGSKQIIQKEKKKIEKSIKSNFTIMFIVAFVLLIVSIYISLFLLREIKEKLIKYKSYIFKSKKDLIEKNIQLKNQIYMDMLTKKQNLKSLMKRLDNKENFTSLLLIDIDDFKVINELYGNKGGDIVLVSFVKLLEQFRDRCSCNFEIYRIGSDEFALLFDEVKADIEYYEDIANRLNNFIDSSDIKIDQEIYIKIDITTGFAYEKEDILIKAEIALNRAKQKKERFLAYSLAIDNRINSQKNMVIKKEIISAIEHDNIIPYYQPIVDRDNHIIKYEVLIRLLSTTTKEVLSPGEFLDIAKKTKLYPKLSRIVIKKAFEKFKDESVGFSINISILDIENIKTMNFLENIIQDNKETAKRLTIEILESEGIYDFEILLNFIAKMKQFGVKIAIDDFGSGYSSFKYILKIKPDFIKIDGSLVENVDSDEDSKTMIKTIVNISKIMHSKTVAEFVYSKEIFDALLKLEVDQFQGYYIKKPSAELST